MIDRDTYFLLTNFIAMMTMVDEIFEIEPEQWGLRGDPFLWEGLKKSLAELVTKSTTTEEFKTLLNRSFLELLNGKGVLTSATTVYIESYPQYGMSGGSVSLTWWDKTGLPLLIERYKQAIS